MRIEAGARLGPYEILAPLGAGGMGEVFRARDVRLGREVAVKVVGARTAPTREVRERFAREAKVVASLSHPHICALFDVGTYEDGDYLVMELLEGESLAERLGRGPLPVEQALRWGAQILDALARAHQSGIVHRDLKPGNVMLTTGGVKLLDFGLAQLRVEPSQDPSFSIETLVTPLTSAGTVLGTLQYMAPEQLEGKRTDTRSDIFAFGAVLYEMVTGRLAFPGTSTASVISKILRDQPEPLSALDVRVPAGLERLLARCLEKDPEQRWQSAQDLRARLLELAEDAAPPVAAVTSSMITAPATSPAAAPATSPASAVQPSRRGLVIVAAAVVLGLALGVVLTRDPTPPPAPTVRFEVPRPPETVFRNIIETVNLALSPNGEHLAFLCQSTAPVDPSSPAGSREAIWVRSLASLEPRRLEGSDGATSIFWSPDGAEIGFVADGRLKRIRLDDNAPVVIGEVPAGIGLAAAWGMDGIVYATVQGDALYRVGLSGGEPEVFVRGEKKGDRTQWPVFLGDGRSLLYVASESQGEGRLMLLRPGMTARTVAPMESRVELAGEDLLVFARDGALVAQHLDSERGELTGAPIPIAPQIQSFRATRHASFTAARSGALAFATGFDEGFTAWYSADGRELGRVGDPVARLNVRISPDGRRALADRFEPGRANYDVSLLDLERNVESPLVTSPGTDAYPVWMPDERSVLLTVAHGKTPKIVRLSLDTGEEEQPVDSGAFQIPEQVSADGRLLFRQRDGNAGFQLFSVRLDEPPPRVPLVVLASKTSIGVARLSPDGRLLAYTEAGAGGFEAYVRPLDGNGMAQRVSVHGASHLAWSPDGRELLFTTPDRRLLAAPITGAPLRVGLPVERFALPGLGWSSFDIASDGRILAAVKSAHGNEAPLTLVVGWSPERSGARIEQ